MSRYKDIISGTFLFLVAVVLYVATYSIQSFTDAGYGVTFVPRVVAIIIAFLSLLVLIQAIKNAKANSNDVVEKDSEYAPNYKSTFLTFVLIIIYMIMLQPVGFILSTTLYLVLQMFILSNFNRDRKKIILFITISTISSVSLYFIFVNLLSVILPAGILG
ncbi:tripartite tricarboxylate transporter TctB family protein [Bacillus sp. Marseille-P3661]|uniref:tripartite tricarboxylate transporter TctB family protein n=1 Tax=Bacillus sp. Marseille-P3661 TaxID=1936234 RepID=UPI0015E1AE2E|nr:tripartite tricarboxylate transporter TctB family protein [Bacillus sp. Marseille-P3661]